jgi:nicotinamidase/pyrazinamidase
MADSRSTNGVASLARVPAIHVFPLVKDCKDVDARHEAGHDGPSACVRARPGRSSCSQPDEAAMAGTITLTDHDVLLAVDVQNDFCPGGLLAVPRGDEIVPTVNRLCETFRHVVLTQDWHPPGHLSFASSHPGRAPFDVVTAPYGPQELWPDHCVQDTPGADFRRDLVARHAELVVRKGFRREIDSYSAFYENDHTTPTGLTGYLRERGFTRVFLAGLAFDFCVRFSAQDARRGGFAAVVIEDACRGIDINGSVAATRRSLAEIGAEVLTSDRIA